VVHPITGRPIAGIATDQGWLDRAAREQEEAPEHAPDLIGISPGMVVADVGAGSGYMTTRIATRIGPTGTVYANDIQPALLQTIQQKAVDRGLANIRMTLAAVRAEVQAEGFTFDRALEELPRQHVIIFRR